MVYDNLVYYRIAFLVTYCPTIMMVYWQKWYDLERKEYRYYLHTPTDTFQIQYVSHVARPPLR
jgi:hypothetical protein